MLWLLLLAHISCGPKHTLLFVQVTGIPSESKSIMLYTLLDGRPADQELLLPLPGREDYTVGLQVEGPSEGTLMVYVGIFDQQDCLHGTGEINTLLSAIDDFRPLSIKVNPEPAVNRLRCQASADPLPLSVTPFNISTTAREQALIDGHLTSQPAALHLHGWGFRPGMQVTLGQRQQVVTRVSSFREADIEAPLLTGELGPTRVTVELAGHPPGVLENGINVVVPPILTILNNRIFKPTTSISVGARPQAVAVAALIKSSPNPFLLFAIPASNKVGQLYGDGGGNFGGTIRYLPVGTSPQALVVADFNADQNLDLAVANAGSNNVSLLLGIGGYNGDLGSATNFAVGSGPTGLAVADVNGV